MSEGRFGIRHPWRFDEQLLRRLPLFDHGDPNEGGVYNLRLYRRKLYPSYICSRVYSRGCYDIEYSFHLRGGRPGVILSTIQGYIIMLPLAADLARLCRKAPRTAQRGLRSRPRRALFLLS